MNVPAYALGPFLTALVAVAVGTVIVRRWAVRRGYVDQPDYWRRVHGTPTSNVGGIAVALGTVVAFAVWHAVVFPGAAPRPEIVAALLAGLLLVGIGFLDDRRHLPAGVKLAVEALIAAGVFLAGVRFFAGGLPSASGSLLAGVSFVVTTFWIVGTTNAFNLIDGSDGVATGAALFGALTLGAISALHGETAGTLLAVIVAGACLGFLVFNFPPASIFLGDGGSLFLGSTLAMLGVMTANALETPLAILVPPLALGLPLLDTTLAIVRRFLRREPIFSADRGHVHHRLHDLGFTPRGVALVLYGACALFSATAFLVALGRPLHAAPVLAAFAVLAALGVARLRMPELMEFAHLVRRGFQGRSIVARNLRVHAAAEVLRASVGGRAIVEALEYAFQGSEFSRLELRVPEPYGAALLAAGNGRVSGRGGSHRMAIEFDSAHPGTEIEVRIPLLLHGGRTGSVHLFRAGEGELELTDLQLVRSDLVPALARALARVRSEAVAKMRSAPRPAVGVDEAL